MARLDLARTQGMMMGIYDSGVLAQVAAGKQVLRLPAKYDPVKAVAYACKYWNKVCSDGFIAEVPQPTPYVKFPLTTTFEHRAQRDPITKVVKHFDVAVSSTGAVVHQWKGMDDCAHFVSCCIGKEPNEAGGGIVVPPLQKLGVPGKVPYGIVGAGKLADWLRNGLKCGIVEITAKNKSDVSKAKPGDVVGCRKNGVPKIDEGYEHVMLYLGKNKIACHTYARCGPDPNSPVKVTTWDDEWNVGEKEGWCLAWTIFQMS